jgi:sugar phosphate isomerase/epimerase
MSPNLWGRLTCGFSRASFRRELPFNRTGMNGRYPTSVCEYADKKGVTLGMEDHAGIAQNTDACLETVHRVDSPFFGMNLDITNFIPTAKDDTYAQIEATVPYATHSHIRDRFENGQAVDLDRVWQFFARSNYKGFMSAECEGEENPSTGAPKLVDKIKALSRKCFLV